MNTIIYKDPALILWFLEQEYVHDGLILLIMRMFLTFAFMAGYFIVLMFFWFLLQYVACVVLAWLVRFENMELHECLARLLLSILWAIQFVLPPTIAWGRMIAFLTDIVRNDFCGKRGYDGIFDSSVCLTQLQWDVILGPRLYWEMYAKSDMGTFIFGFVITCLIFMVLVFVLAVLFFLILNGLYYVLTMLLNVCRLLVCLLDPVVSILGKYQTALQQKDFFFLMREESLRLSPR